MKKIGLLFPHQLYKDSTLVEECEEIYLIEDDLYFNQYKFHKQKLVLHSKTISSQNYLKTLSLNEQISLIGYPTGIYLVKLRLDNGSVFTKRIIKTNQ